MLNYIYLDIETLFTSKYPNFKNDKIISIQVQPIYPKIEPLTIISTWKQNEDDVRHYFYALIKYANKDVVFTGVNLDFERRFFNEQIDLSFDWRYRKMLDLKDVFILGNNLEFENYSKPLGKNHFSKKIPELYQNQEFEKIQNYTIRESKNFIKIFYELKELLTNHFQKQI